MKKLLANGSGAIYSLGPVFRRGESGQKHNPEFTMLEWYRPEFDLSQLLAEVRALFCGLQKTFGLEVIEPTTRTYQGLFEARYGVNPHLSSTGELRLLAERECPDQLYHLQDRDEGERDDLLDLLFSFDIEPELIAPCFVIDFPASQASLARVAQINEAQVALRAEFYWQGFELANGYDELRDGIELSQRMERDNRIRLGRGLPVIEPDADLLEALPKMPNCAGIALGIDRLLMLLLGKNELSDVL
tara:strand:+ start:812 stop:1549 length:738 start_codon:yes stop_codon:yes gene_type:complete